MPTTKRKKRSKSNSSAEPRSSEALTVGWMLMVFTTLTCEIGFFVARWLSADDEAPLRMLSELLLFAALVIGLLSLLITPVVVRGRRSPPPASVTALALVVSAAPLFLAAIEMLN